MTPPQPITAPESQPGASSERRDQPHQECVANAEVSEVAVAIRAAGAREPLFLVGDGSAAHISVLASHIDPEIPLYALPGVPFGEPGLHTIEGMAAHLLRIVREIRAAGPYCLLGWSFGGAVAYELAAQLIGQDQSVAFLGLLDAYGPESLAHRRALESYMVHPLPIPLHVFAGADVRRLPGQPPPISSLGWSEALPEQRARRLHVPGNGYSVFDVANAPALGRAVSSAMADARRQPSRLLEAQYRPQFTIQTGQRQYTPIFCLPGAGDSVVAFTALAEALGETWPVQGLQARGLDGALVPHSSVEAAAVMHVRAIREVQPEGPVHLLGHSFGGWVALQIAHELRAARRAVASLTIIDTEAPDSNGTLGREYTASEALMELVGVLELAAGKSLGIDGAARELLDARGSLQLLHEGCVRVGLLPRGSRPDALRGVLRVFSTALRTGYRPQRAYPDPVRLVLVSDPRREPEAERCQHDQTLAAWRRWAPKLTSCHGPGNHVAVLKPPHVQALADGLRARFEQPSRRSEAGGGHLPLHACNTDYDPALASKHAGT